MAISIMTSPLAADLIQTRASDARSDEAEQAVAERLVELGTEKEQARVTAALLSDRTVERYAAAPSDLQMAGQVGPDAGQDLFAGQVTIGVEELVLGIVVLVAVGLAIEHSMHLNDNGDEDSSIIGGLFND